MLGESEEIILLFPIRDELPRSPLALLQNPVAIAAQCILLTLSNTLRNNRKK
ncbi:MULTISPECIES: hypothetical protein [Planktothricoides]|uniref:Uncharacterized protein n=2 Tax=Planktothricoides raciborskii TaxID=132608 RepID=A0AAU8JAU9_9CYAN|nr:MULTISPECIES: hypothetical protein [Planktothricoides]MBD2544654.1 hypothetical protein [Planktothricoides raciborskii FACHB-1370]MBD2580739.1 hypothetical protein [Planktothricoides raciborskii FACHB-1261]